MLRLSGPGAAPRLFGPGHLTPRQKGQLDPCHPRPRRHSHCFSTFVEERQVRPLCLATVNSAAADLPPVREETMWDGLQMAEDQQQLASPSRTPPVYVPKPLALSTMELAVPGQIGDLRRAIEYIWENVIDLSNFHRRDCGELGATRCASDTLEPSGLHSFI